MKEKKRYRMKFSSKWGRKTMYVSCAEEDLQGEKERWAMFLAEQTGVEWNCTSVTEVDANTVYIGNRERGD